MRERNLADRFDDDRVAVDKSVHNPSRIWKLYGTLASKGDDTPSRPHRMARVLQQPSEISVVELSLLELLAGNWANAIVILAFAWIVMGFLIDNVLRLIFIGMLKRSFGFEYRMNDILILLSILAGIATIGFWGLIIGPSVLALTLAAANLYSSGMKTYKNDEPTGDGE